MTIITQKFARIPSHKWLQLIIILPVLLVSLYVAFSPADRLLNWFNNDDGFYYFVVARNIAGGNGVTFDGINLTNGFHPLWMLVCIPIFAIFKADPISPLRVVILVFGMLQAVSMLLLFYQFKKILPPLLSTLLVFLFGFSSSVYFTIYCGGLESAISLLGIILLIFLTQKYRADRKNLLLLILTGLVAGLTVLSRLDTIFTVIFLGLWCVFDRTEDSNQLLFDIIAACLVVMLSAGLRLGFSLFNFTRTIISLLVLWAGVGALGNFLNGHYSYKPRFFIKNRILRTLIIHAAVTGVVVTLTWLLTKAGFIETWSRMVLVFSSAGWLVYTFLKGKLLASTRTEPDTKDTPSFRRLFITWIRKPLAYYLPVLILLGSFMLWSQIQFGTPMPVSGQIKVWWGTLGITVYGAPIHSFEELLEFLFGKGSPFHLLSDTFGTLLPFLKSTSIWRGILSWVILGSGFLFLIFMGQKARLSNWLSHLAVLPLAAGILLRLIYFFVTGYVHLRKWYWGTETLLIFFLFTAFIGSLWWMLSSRKTYQYAAVGALIVLVMFSVTPLLRETAGLYSWKANPADPHEYLAVTHAIEENTEPHAVIGIPGGGAISYFIKDRTIINLDGLMNSKEYFDLLQHFDTHAFMQKMEIRYIYAHETVVLGSLPFFRIFDDRLSPILLINDKYLYRYQ